jgi:FAD/FMN-containing dehydrogenase/Fe-S oxidoreductase
MGKNWQHKVSFSRLAGRVDGEVHTDALRRYMLSTDASIFRVMPLAVVYPKSTTDVQTTVRFAAQHGLPVHARGSGSGLCGSAVGDGVVLDFSKYMNRLVKLDQETKTFVCQPGFRLGELEAVLDGSPLFFPPDPSSGEYASFGGMCNTNASGARSIKYGNVADYLMDAEIVFADGTSATLSQLEGVPIARLADPLQRLAGMYGENADVIEKSYPPIACNVAGYNLRGMVQDGRLRLHRLLAGSEGTLAVVTQLTFRLIAKPAANALVVAYFDDMADAAKAVQMTMPLSPSGIEIMDKSLLNLARASDETLRERIPEGVDNVLLIEFDGASQDGCAAMAAEAQQLLLGLQLTRRVYRAATAKEKAKFWAVRKAAVPILYKLKGRKKIVALVEDAALPVNRLVSYVNGIYEIFDRHGVSFVLYGHISKGLIHTRPLLDLKDPRDVALLRPIADDVYDLVDGLGGTISGEHGDGRLRSAYLHRKYPKVYALFQKTKALLDPQGLFNPDIKNVKDPDQMSRHLRFGSRYRVIETPFVHLQWPETFGAEAERCHGCSKCTTITSATRMCPVYKSTRDEAAAPKSKANVLRGLLSGGIGQRPLFDAALQQVMAQCVNCGSCAAECPSNVNIPKLAMEAKAQYVRHYGAAFVDQLTANVATVARLTHRLSPLVTPLVRTAWVRKASARLTGLAPQRQIVTFARRSLYQQLPVETTGRGPAILFFAGCYAGYMRPELGLAAVNVLSRLGFHVYLPPQSCCGLPQLSKGLAVGAMGETDRNVKIWQGLLPNVKHVVVTCSSCGFALMRDWGYLIHDRGLAEQIGAKTIHISKLLTLHLEKLKLEDTPIKLAYHQPCHLRIQPHGNSSIELLAMIPGIEIEDLQNHCCGIAGSWGMIHENYGLSKAIGKPMIQKLKSSNAKYGVTDCPTCQMQMEHLGNLPVRHPVEVISAALPRRF